MIFSGLSLIYCAALVNILEAMCHGLCWVTRQEMGDLKYCSQLVLRAPEHTIGLSKKAICICLLASEGVTGFLMCYYIPGAGAAHHQGVFPSQTNEEFSGYTPCIHVPSFELTQLFRYSRCRHGLWSKRMFWVDASVQIEELILVIGRRLPSAETMTSCLQAPGRQGGLCGAGSAAEGGEPGCLMIWCHFKQEWALSSCPSILQVPCSCKTLLPSFARSSFLCSSGSSFLLQHHLWHLAADGSQSLAALSCSSTIHQSLSSHASLSTAHLLLLC